MSTDPEKIARLEANYNNVIYLLDKYDKTLEKVTEVEASITQMLTVHEARLNQQEKDTHELAKSTEKDINNVRNLFDHFEEDFQERCDKRHENEHKNCDKENSKVYELINSFIINHEKKHSYYKVELDDTFSKLDSRTKKLERFQYAVIACCLFLGFLTEKVLPLIISVL